MVSRRKTDESKVGGFRKEISNKDHEKTQEPGIREKISFTKNKCWSRVLHTLATVTALRAH